MMSDYPVDIRQYLKGVDTSKFTSSTVVTAILDDNFIMVTIDYEEGNVYGDCCYTVMEDWNDLSKPNQMGAKRLAMDIAAFYKIPCRIRYGD